LTTARLKNATSTSKNSFAAIQKTLVDHKAQRVTFVYDKANSGRIVGIEFEIEINGVLYPFKLPARIERVEKRMYGRMGNGLSISQREQAYRTTWANIRDWISSQCAMIDVHGKTVFEAMSEQQFLLPSGER